MILLEDQIKCLKREIALRKNVYPGFVRSGRMKQEDADLEIMRMTAVLQTVTDLKDFLARDTARWEQFSNRQAGHG